ncbi:MAG: calcium/sodium antiporter [Eubacteriales bacterium]
MISLFCLIVGFVLLVWGADNFVEGASALARKMGIPSLIVGLTVVAFGTSAPELAVSVTAGLSGANEIALGNVLGSNIFNLLFVAGLSAVIRPLVVEKDLLNRDWIATIIATSVLMVLLIIDGDISRVDALILLVGFSVVMFLQITAAKKNKIKEMEEISKDKSRNITFHMVVGLGCIIAGGQISVYGATELARIFGLSETLIGLTVVAIGTSLPELVTSLMATKRGENSIAAGNVIGSNLFNILFILGISCFINPIQTEITAVFDTFVLLAVTLIMFVLAKKDKLNRTWGIALSLLYVLYTVWIILR